MLLILQSTFKVKPIIPDRSLFHTLASSMSDPDLGKLSDLQSKPIRLHFNCLGPNDVLHLRRLKGSLMLLLLLGCQFLLL